MAEENVKDGAGPSALPKSSSGSTDSASPAKDIVEVDDSHSRSHSSSIIGEDEEKFTEACPPLTRQSTELGPAVKVPRLKRRGLFGQLTLVAEVEDPKTYPRPMKWFITFVVAVAAVVAPMGSAIFFRKLKSNDCATH